MVPEWVTDVRAWGGEDSKAGEEGKTDKSKTILYIVEVCPRSPVNMFPPQVHWECFTLSRLLLQEVRTAPPLWVGCHCKRRLEQHRSQESWKAQKEAQVTILEIFFAAKATSSFLSSNLTFDLAAALWLKVVCFLSEDHTRAREVAGVKSRRGSRSSFI